VAERRHPRGLIDTSVVIDLELIDPTDLPLEVAVSAVTMAELAAGPHATADPSERARRQDRLALVRAIDWSHLYGHHSNSEKASSKSLAVGRSARLQKTRSRPAVADAQSI